MDTTASPFPAREELARLLPRYRLIRRLSETGMSEVWLAADTSLHGREVALKVLLPHLASMDGYRERFIREVRVVAGLQHPNIINIFDATQPGEDLLYLVMPYINGPNLRTLIEHNRGPLELDHTIRIAEQVADALAHAHQHGVAHRDVKPSNILVNGHHVYLCDFGIAKESSGEHLTLTGQSVGTPGYMPPERYPSTEEPVGDTMPITPRPAVTALDRWGDVYALGAVLHHCLTGRPPFNHSDVRAMEWEQRHGDPPLVSQLRPGLPKAVDHVVRKAMARDPGQRYGTCTELVDALQDAARPRPLHRRLPRPSRRAVAIGAVAAAVILIAGVIIVPSLGERVGVLSGDAPSAEQLARIPAALREHCQVADASTGAPGATKVLSCVDGNQPVLFSLFDQSSTMDSAFAGVATQASVPRGSGDCTMAAPAEHRYPGSGTATGRVLCYSADGDTSIIWTDDAARTLARASSREADDLALHRSWPGWVGLAPFPTADESALRDVVELGDCQRAPAGTVDAFRNVLAAIECVASGVSQISYYRFADLDGLTRAYEGQVSIAKAPAWVDCGDGTAPGFLGHSRLDMRSVDVGRLLCSPGPQNTSVLTWTMDPLLIMGRAAGTEPKALTDWWGRYFGNAPPTGKIAEAVNAAAKPPFPTAEEQALLGHIPERTRVNCMRPPPEQIALNVRDATVTAVVCGPTRGASIVFYYQFNDAVALKVNYDGYTDISGPDCTKSPPDFHGNAPYSQDGFSGRLACATSAVGTTLTWSNDQLKILGLAFHGAEPFPLLDWWRFEAGPK